MIKSFFKRERPVAEVAAALQDARAAHHQLPERPLERGGRRRHCCCPRAAPGGRCSTGVAALVASSRVYVRIHHATDVVGGVGAPALVIGTAARAFRRRGRSWIATEIAECPDPRGVARRHEHSTFAVTWDYRCPFARNVHDHVVTGLEAGADWDVHFVPFSLGQVHVGRGRARHLGAARRRHRPARPPGRRGGTGPPPRAVPGCAPGAVRGPPPRGLKLHDPDAVAQLPRRRRGRRRRRCSPPWPRAPPSRSSASEHEAIVASHDVWGVPTFIVGDRGRLRPPDGHARRRRRVARRSVERVVDLLTGWPDLNEFKHTSIPR